MLPPLGLGRSTRLSGDGCKLASSYRTFGVGSPSSSPAALSSSPSALSSTIDVPSIAARMRSAAASAAALCVLLGLGPNEKKGPMPPRHDEPPPPPPPLFESVGLGSLGSGSAESPISVGSMSTRPEGLVRLRTPPLTRWRRMRSSRNLRMRYARQTVHRPPQTAIRPKTHSIDVRMTHR